MVQVTTTFVGASATDVEASVATPAEQKINGVENSIYMKSTNANDGTLTLKVSFDVGSNLDMANVLTQNKLSEAMPQLPASVKTYGVAVKKALAFPLLVISIKSPNGTYDNNFLSNYTTINIQDNLARIKGVGQINLFGGSDYAMRVWLRPDRIARLGITVPDIVNAISQQNTLSPSGQFGGQPAAPGTEFTYTVRTQGRLLNEAEFGEIIVRSNPDGSQVRLKDVARIELGTQLYNAVGRHDGKPAAVLAVFQIPGTNALAVADEIKKTMEDLKTRFPRDLEYKVSLDTTLPVSEGITEIIHTLFEAVVLVIIVVFIFLQNWRATLIPLLTVPVSLVGAFIFFPMLGFSINVLSLLGLVLAIGIVVDDAIVVVEAVMHHIEHGMTPKDATFKAMEEVSGPVVAIALILAAVFVPVGFMPGISGMLYQQFAITIAISVLLSAFNALTLSPALAALLLKAPTGKKTLLTPFYRIFNKAFGKGTDVYITFAGFLARKLVVSLALIGVLIFLTVTLVGRIPGGFVPEEDQGYILVNAMLPDASSLRADRRRDEEGREDPARERGRRGLQHDQRLQPADRRVLLEHGLLLRSAQGVEGAHDPRDCTRTASSTRSTRRSPGRSPRGSSWPSARRPSRASAPARGSRWNCRTASATRRSGWPQQADQFIAAARKRPEIGRLSTLYRANVPQVYADIDRSKVLKVGVPIADVNTTLGALLGSSYVNDFNRFGRVYKVYVQAEPEYRRDPKQLGLFYVRSAKGDMVPLDTVVSTRSTSGPEFTNRFNLYRAAEVTGVPAEGYSSAQALKALEEVAAEVLSPDMGYDWADMSYQEKRAPNPLPTFAVAIFLVFLVLAAQYESWTLPFSVLLGTPFAAFGAYFGLWAARHYSNSYVNNIFAQIGLIMLIGLAAKNAILIVEFAKMLHEQGKDVYSAAIESAKLRFRPILMTAFAFILGVVPLVRASGAGAESRKVMGMTVFAGMLIATILGVLLVPMLFTLVGKLTGSKPGPVPDTGPPAHAPEGGGH